MDPRLERTGRALVVGLPAGAVIAVVLWLTYENLFLAASSGFALGVVIAAYLADRWERLEGEDEDIDEGE